MRLTTSNYGSINKLISRNEIYALYVTLKGGLYMENVGFVCVY